MLWFNKPEDLKYFLVGNGETLPVPDETNKDSWTECDFVSLLHELAQLSRGEAHQY